MKARQLIDPAVREAGVVLEALQEYLGFLRNEDEEDDEV